MQTGPAGFETERSEGPAALSPRPPSSSATGLEILERLIAEEGLRVVGAEYDLESGEVDFFEGV